MKDAVIHQDHLQALQGRLRAAAQQDLAPADQAQLKALAAELERAWLVAFTHIRTVVDAANEKLAEIEQ